MKEFKTLYFKYLCRKANWLRCPGAESRPKEMDRRQLQEEEDVHRGRVDGIKNS